MRPRIYKTIARASVSKAVYAALASLGLLTIAWGAVDPRSKTFQWLLLAWLATPPLWIAIEYFFWFDNWGDRQAVGELRFGLGLAVFIWFAVIVLFQHTPELGAFRYIAF